MCIPPNYFFCSKLFPIAFIIPTYTFRWIDDKLYIRRKDILQLKTFFDGRRKYSI